MTGTLTISVMNIAAFGDGLLHNSANIRVSKDSVKTVDNNALKTPWVTHGATNKVPEELAVE
jgi:hypothetical protein